jgi:hypothetical protein
MYRLSVALLLVAAICLGLSIVGCNALALGGEKKYKVDLQNALLRISDQIEKNGEVSDDAIAKLQGVLEKYKEDFSGNGSYTSAESLIETLNKVKDEPGNEFSINQSALVIISDIQDTLKTEIKE